MRNSILTTGTGCSGTRLKQTRHASTPDSSRNLLHRTILALIGTAVLGLTASGAVQAADLDIPVIYLKLQPERPPILSNLIKWPEDEGDRGAELGIADNNTTGKFLNQKYSLRKIIEPVGGDPVAAARKALAGGPRLVILNVPADAVKKIAALEEAQDELVIQRSKSRVRIAK